jgi:hypothetical protein
MRIDVIHRFDDGASELFHFFGVFVHVTLSSHKRGKGHIARLFSD